MLPTTGGSFCPSCGHRVKSSTIFDDGPPTPPLGVPAASPGMVRDAVPLASPGASPGADDKPLHDMQDGTILYGLPALEPTGEMPRPPTGASASDGGFAFGPGPGAGLPPSAMPTVPDLAEDGLPSLQPEAEGSVDATVVIAPSGAPGELGAAQAAEDVEGVLEIEPEHKEALFLPRCKSCDKVLDLEEVADGECAECRRSSRRGRARGRPRRRAGPPVRLHCAVSGTLAALAATWIGVLVIVHAVQSNPDTWKAPDLVFASARGVLVVFCLVASILWACEQAWAGGAALALGPAAAAAAAFVLTSGALVENLTVASAWVLAGFAGAVATVSAALPRKELYVASQRGRRRGRRARSKRSPDDEGDEPRSRRGGRKSSFGVNRLRAVLGGVVALAGAGVAGWRFVVAFRADPKVFAEFSPAAVGAGGLAAAALVGMALALWLLAFPPRGKTHVVAIAAAAVAGALPVVLMLGAHLGRLAGAGVVDPSGALALVAGLARLLGVGLPAPEAPGEMAFALKAAAAGGLVAALAASLFVLFTEARGRGKGLAGFALSWVLAWGAGFATALAAGG